MKIKKYLDEAAKEFKPTQLMGLQIVGPFYDGLVPLQEPLIFVDAGVQYRAGTIGISVGDGDSSTIPLDHQLDVDKDFSDLAFVLQNIPTHNVQIQLLGFLGHRQDHQLMNITEVHRYLKTCDTLQVMAQFDQSIYALSKGTWKMQIKGSFSLFSFEEIDLVLTGACKYQVGVSAKFQYLSSQGLSNAGHGEINLQISSPLFIFTSVPVLLSSI